MTKSLFPLFALLLSACTGSALVYGEDAPQGTFPDLHDVPDKPNFPTQSASKSTEGTLATHYAQTMQENTQRRSAAGFDTTPVK